MKRFAELIKKIDRFAEINVLATDPGEITRLQKSVLSAAQGLFNALKANFKLIPDEIMPAARGITIYDQNIDTLPVLIQNAKTVSAGWKNMGSAERQVWLKGVSPAADQLTQLATQYLQALQGWRTGNQ